MSDIGYLFIILALIGVIVFILIRHEKERKDLYNRIMSKDVQDYRIITGQDEPPRAMRPMLNRKKAFGAALKEKYEEGRD